MQDASNLKNNQYHIAVKMAKEKISLTLAG